MKKSICTVLPLTLQLNVSFKIFDKNTSNVLVIQKGKIWFNNFAVVEPLRYCFKKTIKFEK